MATVKISLTFDESLLAAARELVGRLQRDRLAGLLEELEREVGPIEPRDMEDVRRLWPAPAGNRT